MGKKSDPPDYPTELMQKQIELNEKLGTRYLDLSEQQQAWAEEQWGQTYSLLKETLGVQTEVQLDQLRNAQKDRARYEKEFQPLEDDLIQEFRDYDSPERRELESGRAQAQVQQGFDAQRRNAEKRLEGYGIDPSETRGRAIDTESRIAAAAAQAGAGNKARQDVENVGRALRADAINIGRGLPSQVAQSYGQTLQASQQNMGAQTGAIASGASTMGTGMQWGQMAGNASTRAMSGINNMHSGQLASYEAGGGALGAMGSLAGQALGAYVGGGGTFGLGKEDGGQVGNPAYDAPPGPNDTEPTMLEPGEYVVPANVVRRKGTDFFDKLRDKANEQDQMEGAQQGAEVMRTAGLPLTAPQPRQQAIAA